MKLSSPNDYDTTNAKSKGEDNKYKEEPLATIFIWCSFSTTTSLDRIGHVSKYPNVAYVYADEAKENSKLAEWKNWVLQNHQFFNIFLRKFQIMVPGSIESIDAKDINVTQSKWLSGCPM